jgi:hypothetical protein
MCAKDACQGAIFVAGASCVLTTQVSQRNASDFVTHCHHTPLHLCCQLDHNMIQNSQLLGGGLEYCCEKNCKPCYFLIMCAQFLSRGQYTTQIASSQPPSDVPKVLMKQFIKGTNVGSNNLHPSLDFDDGVLMPKLAKKSEFDLDGQRWKRDWVVIGS